MSEQKFVDLVDTDEGTVEVPEEQKQMADDLRRQFSPMGMTFDEMNEYDNRMRKSLEGLIQKVHSTQIARIQELENQIAHLKISRTGRVVAKGGTHGVEELNAVVALVRAIRMVLGTSGIQSRQAAEIQLTCVTINPTKFWARGIKHMQMTDKQSTTATLAAFDDEGNPASANLPSAPTWESSDPAIVTVVPAPDGLSAVISSPSPGPLGSAVVTVKAKIGSESLEATLAVDIIAGDATKIEITTSEPA